MNPDIPNIVPRARRRKQRRRSHTRRRHDLCVFSAYPQMLQPWMALGWRVWCYLLPGIHGCHIAGLSTCGCAKTSRQEKREKAGKEEKSKSKAHLRRGIPLRNPLQSMAWLAGLVLNDSGASEHHNLVFQRLPCPHENGDTSLALFLSTSGFADRFNANEPLRLVPSILVLPTGLAVLSRE